MKFVQDIIIRPLITERSMDGVAEKKFSFEVAKNATKPKSPPLWKLCSRAPR